MLKTVRELSPLAWRNLWRNPKRTLITLIVVSVGLWSVLFFSAFMRAWAVSSKDATLSLLIASGQIHAKGYLDDPSVELLMPPVSARLRQALDQSGISHWATRVQVPGVIQSEYKTLPVSIVGVDPDDEQAISSVPSKLVSGRYLEGVSDDAVVMGLHMAERLKTGLGRRVILMSQQIDGSLSEQSFDVVGLFDADKQTEDFYVFTGRAAAQDFLRVDQAIAQIVFQVQDEDRLAEITQNLADAAPELDVRSWKKLSAMLAATDDTLDAFIYIWLGVVFALMAIGIINTQLMAVFERTHEFGLLRALGMKPRLLLLMVSLENAWLMGIGVSIGTVLAALTIAAALSGIDLSAFAEGLELFQGGRMLYPEFHIGEFITFPILIWWLGILVALWPARRAAKSKPVDAMRH